MKMSEMFPSKYLAKEDVPNPIAASIKSVVQTELDGDGGKETKNVVMFNGAIKPMILNKGNAVALCEAYGDESAYWAGKPVEIYVDPSVMFGGKRVGGLRLRVPGATTAPPPQQFWTIEQAVQNCAAAGIGRDEMIAYLKENGASAYNGLRCTPLVQALIASKSQAPEVPFDGGGQYDPNDIPFSFGWVALLLLPALNMIC